MLGASHLGWPEIAKLALEFAVRGPGRRSSTHRRIVWYCSALLFPVFEGLTHPCAF